jgi:signal transduction histidine kinase
MNSMKNPKSSFDGNVEYPMGVTVNDGVATIAPAELQIGLQVAGVALIKFDYVADQVILSPEAAIMYGLPTDECVISRDRLHQTCHPDEYCELLNILEQALDPNGTGWLEYQHRVVLPTGEIRWLSVRQQVYFDHSSCQSHPIWASLAAIDITDQKHREDVLAEQNNQLNDFICIVSHDLKAPLRGISRLSEWLEEDLKGVLSVEIQQQICLLRQRVQRLSLMIDQLLYYARTRHTEITIEAVNLEELLLEIIDSLGPPATFTITISPNLPSLYTKRLHLSQVLMNLIGNAIKHHDRADGSIQITVKETANFYEFSVADDGPGIAMEYQDRIFTMFQTGHLEHRSDSTGIGLAIAKKIIENESGKIDLYSQRGRGTTLSFTWPR